MSPPPFRSGDPDLLRAYSAFAEQARALGVHGVAGQCFATALALNRIAFGSAGRLALACNRPLAEHGHIVGHAAVEIDGRYFDIDGRPKPADEITSWGELDPTDPDYFETFEAFGLEFTEDAAGDVELVHYMHERDFLSAVPVAPDILARIEALLDRVLPPPLTITPGTRLYWRTLGDWLECAFEIDARRSSQARYGAIERHWTALSLPIIKRADKPSTLRFIAFLDNSRGGCQAWARPPRGKRRDTLWETYNVEARNRLARLLKAEDDASLSLGHNSLGRSSSVTA
jgi:hypothetical protein